MGAKGDILSTEQCIHRSKTVDQITCTQLEQQGASSRPSSSFTLHECESTDNGRGAWERDITAAKESKGLVDSSPNKNMNCVSDGSVEKDVVSDTVFT